MRVFIPLAIATFLSASAWASLKPLSLQDAVQFALENSPAFDTAKKTQAIRELENKNAFAKLLPSVDFSTTNGLQNNIPIASANGNTSLWTPNSSAPWYSSVNLGVSETLYDNGVSFINLSITHLNRELAALAYLKNRDSLALDVASEFYRYSLATTLLEVRKQQQAVLEKQLKALSSQYQQGFKTKSDFLRIKAQAQRAEIDRITAENNIILSSAELRKLLGVSYRDKDPPSFNPIRVNRDQSIERRFPKKTPPFENTYDYRITKIQEQVNDKAVTLTQRNFWPQVSVISGVSYYNQNYLNSNTEFSAGNQLSWNAVLTLQYNIWDWGTRRRDVEISKYNRDIQENSMNQGLLEINAKITGVMADISRISHNYKLSQELLSLEEESNRNLEIQYREGKVTYLDLVTSLNSLLDAKVQFHTSYFDALQAVAKYRFYEGNIYEALVEK